jgi:hypothetical protein
MAGSSKTTWEPSESGGKHEKWGLSWMSQQRDITTESSRLTRGPPKRKNYTAVETQESTTDFSVHHPYSQFYLDFILLKALFFLFTVLLCIFMWVLKYPIIFGIAFNSEKQIQSVENDLAVLEVLLFLCSIIWGIFIVRVYLLFGTGRFVFTTTKMYFLYRR